MKPKTVIIKILRPPFILPHPLVVAVAVAVVVVVVAVAVVVVVAVVIVVVVVVVFVIVVVAVVVVVELGFRKINIRDVTIVIRIILPTIIPVIIRG
jgi:hypothetical protein